MAPGGPARVALAAAVVAACCMTGALAGLDRAFQRLIDKEDRKPFIYIYEMPDVFNNGERGGRE